MTAQPSAGPACPADEIAALFARLAPRALRPAAFACVGGAEWLWPGEGEAGSRAARRMAELALLAERERTLVEGRRTWLVSAVEGPYPGICGVSAADVGRDVDLRPVLAAVRRQFARRQAFALAVADDPFAPLLAASPSLAAAADTLRRVAPTKLSVLILGETGAGKEVLARALHAASGRAGPFVAENCAALPEALLEAELFGARRGAFTGASIDRKGRIAEAHGGTLLLDEIGDLPAPLQAKLLRALQTGEVRALGADRARAVDVRIVAATHRRVDASGSGFRRDLYYRLAAVVVEAPPLRARRGDLPYLVASLLARAAAEGLGPGRRIDGEGLAVLACADFPGNVRELDNLLRRAAALSTGPSIPGPLLRPPPPSAEFPTNLEARAILEALKLADGKKTEAARRLGWTRQKLYRRLAALFPPGFATARRPRQPGFGA